MGSDKDEPSRQDLARRLQGAQLLIGLSADLLAVRDLDAVLRRIVDDAIRLTHAERGFLALVREGRYELAAPPGAEHLLASASRTVMRDALERSVPVRDQCLPENPDYGSVESVVQGGARSVLCIPICITDRESAVIYLDHSLDGMFSDFDQRLVAAFANLAGQALRNLRAWEELDQEKRRNEELRARLAGLLEDATHRAQAMENLALRERQALARDAAGAIVGESPAIRELLGGIRAAAESAAPVVIRGETGSGKELVARAVHALGPRRDGPFMAVNCGALSESLLESELFGHARGAFTGADADRKGLFEIAQGGTLLLDELGEMPLDMQTRLLRLLQEGEVRRVGDNQVRKIDVRVLASTHRDLAALRDEGRFREDLYFRLNVIVIRVPPLRERGEDIRLLAGHFLSREARPRPLTAEALRALEGHDWPGNVRELAHLVKRLCVRGEGPIAAAEVEAELEQGRASLARGGGEVLPLRKDDGIWLSLPELEREVLARMYRSLGPGLAEVARASGIDATTVSRKLEKWGLREPSASKRKSRP